MTEELGMVFLKIFEENLMHKKIYVNQKLDQVLVTLRLV